MSCNSYFIADAIQLSAAGQVLKLPAGKYTVREREMMTGSGVPAEFFHATSALGKTVLIGTYTLLREYTLLRGTSSLICVHHICVDSKMNKGSLSCTSLAFQSCSMAT